MTDTAQRNRLNTIIAGHPYNPAQWNSDFEKFTRITSQSLRNPGKYKPEEIESRAEDLCNRRFGALYSDIKEYFKEYELPYIRILSLFIAYFSSNENIYDTVDYSQTDQEILSSLRLSLRQFADDHAKEIFGIDPQKNPEQQQYNKAPTPYKDSFEMPIDKINNDLYNLLHTEGMKKKYNIAKAGQDPVYVTTILTPFIPEETKRKDIEQGIAKLKELSYSVDVLQAAYQLYKPTERIEFTAAQVFRTLQTEYKKTHKDVPATSEKEIEEILDAWYSVMIDIGAEQQLTQWRNADPDNIPDNFVRGNFMRVLPVAFSKATYTTRTADGKHITTVKKTYIYNPDGNIIYPPTLQYSKDVSKQIATFPDALLNPPVNFTNLSKTINLHLLNYIDAMKKRNRSTKILYSTIAHEIGYFRQQNLEYPKPIPGKKKQTLRESVRKHLDYFVQQGFISSYYETPENNRSKDGVQIILPGQDQPQPEKKKGRSSKKEKGE